MHLSIEFDRAGYDIAHFFEVTSQIRGLRNMGTSVAEQKLPGMAIRFHKVLAASFAMPAIQPFNEQPVTAVPPPHSAPAGLCVRPCTATSEQLQTFVEDTWTEAYRGRMAFPVWTAEYFDWIRASSDASNRCLCVYDQRELVAVLLGVQSRFQTPHSGFSGGHWSWLSVAKSHRGRGLAKRLDATRVDLEKAARSDLIVSYRFVGSRYSLAERESRLFPLKKFHQRLGFWARPLDGHRLHQWTINRAEGLLSRLVMPVLPSVKWTGANGGGNGIRLFHHGDLADCVQAAATQFRDCVLKVRWDKSSLRQQLTGSAISQTVVAEHQGRVQGFINFHILPFQARTRELVAVVDLICVNQLPARQQRALIKNALGLMRDQGAILALKIRCGDVSAPLMLATNFTPRWPDSSLVLQWTRSVQRIPKRRPIHVLWR